MEKTDSTNATTLDTTGNPTNIKLGPSTQLIIDTALNRNIQVDFIIPEKGLFRLTSGKKTIYCNRSLTELTSVISAEICVDKYMTNSILRKAGIRVPNQILASTSNKNFQFFKQNKRVVTKPLSESLGRGVSVDIRSYQEMEDTIKLLKVSGDENVLIEEFVEGEDVRVIIIDYKFIAAIHRTPPQVTGDGSSTIEELITKLNLEKPSTNQVPINYETKRCVKLSGYNLTDILPKNEIISVRKNTNEHTGGVPVDVTQKVNPFIKKIAEKIARVINIPVIGIDFLVSSVGAEDYYVIEVNARPGLDGHEPQPVAERFIDFLFPETAL